jgi:hypothetical protein
MICSFRELRVREERVVVEDAGRMHGTPMRAIVITHGGRFCGSRQVPSCFMDCGAL